MSDAAPDRLTLLNAVQPLASADPVGLWPATPAAWLLLLLILALCLAAGLVARRRRLRNLYRAQALQALSEMEQQSLATPGNMALARLAGLLRWTALQAFPRDNLVAMTGSAWIDFLHRAVPSPALDPSALQHINDLAYAPPALAKSLTPADLTAIFATVRLWIVSHRRHD